MADNNGTTYTMNADISILSTIYRHHCHCLVFSGTSLFPEEEQL